eukprot:s918_g11.t2
MKASDNCPPEEGIDIVSGRGEGECREFQFRLGAAEFHPEVPEHHIMDEMLHDLYAQWQERALAWEHESPCAHFLVWYLAPSAGRTRCLFSKRVALSEDFWNWKNHIKAVWLQELLQGIECEFILVDPRPSQMEPGIAGHIILLQVPQPETVPVLISVFDHAINAGHPFKQAHILPEMTNAQTIFGAVGYAYDCATIAQCRIQLRGFALGNTERIRGSSGDAFDLLVTRNVLPVSWVAPFRPHRPGTEGLNLMQTGAKVMSAKMATHEVVLDKSPSDSLTDEFLAAVNAAEDAARQEPIALDPNAIDAQSVFVQELWDLWHDVALRNEEFQEPILRIETWYVNHAGNDRCYHPRVVMLSNDFRAWEVTLLAAWSDRAIIGQEATFAAVYPDPEDMAAGAAVQVVIGQQMRADRRSIVLSVYDTDPEIDPLRTFCLTVDDRISMESLLDTLFLTAECPPQIASNECFLWFGTIPVHAHRVIHLRTGNALRLVIKRGIPLDIPALLSLPDHRLRRELQEAIGGTIFRRPTGPEFMRHVSVNSAAMPATSTDGRAHAAPASAATRDERPTWLIALHDLFQREAFIEMEEEGPVMYVLIWFLHGTRQHRCVEPRVVRLTGPSFEWRTELVFAWRDLLQRGEPIELHIVRPNPPKSPWQSHVAHVLMTQGIMSEQVPVLLSAVMQTPNEAFMDHVACILSPTVPFLAVHNLIVPAAFRRRPTRARRGNQVLEVAHEITLQQGDGIVLEILAVRSENDTMSDGDSLLQIHPAHVVNKPDEQSDEQIDELKVDMQPAIDAFEWLDGHFLLPNFVLPDRVSIPAGLAAAAFVRNHSQWFQGGFISAALPDADSYGAELRAAIVAAKFAHDLLKMILLMGPQVPDVWFGFDSITVGKQMLGQWKCTKSTTLGRCVRMIIEIIEARFETSCKGWHVPSHQGEPGNELVDALAAAAAQGHATHDVSHFLDYVGRTAFVRDCEWIWMLFDKRYAQRWVGGHVVLPSKPTSTPEVDLIPSHTLDAVTCENDTCVILMKLASGNVLTLKGEGPSRQANIFRQFAEAGAHMFALQETRLKRLPTSQNADYLLFSSSATENGHFGILLGFNHRLPHGYLVKPDGTRNEVTFKAEHFAIIERDPRVLVIRVRTPVLRGIVVAAHAPHTGATDLEIEQWWRDLCRRVPPKYADWERILLVDANARVGSIPSDSVGTWQAEADTDKSMHFLDYLHEQALWLPATFETCQIGPGGTWLHNNGCWLRNDFVGIPYSWKSGEVKAYVSTDIDLSTVKEDHAVAILEVKVRGTPVPSRHTLKTNKRCESDIVPDLSWKLTQPFTVDWSWDVHSHAAQLQAHLLKCIPRKRKEWKPLKTTISEATWALVKVKKAWRNQLWECNQMQRKCWLQLCFAAWVGRDDDTIVSTVCHMNKKHDVLVATAYHQFRVLGAKVLTASRRDDAEFFECLAKQASELTSPHQSREFWKVIRRSLPKMKQRRQVSPPMQLEHLEEQWHPYFQDLEVGSFIAPAELVKECHSFQLDQRRAHSTYRMTDFPSKAQIAAVFREAQPHKSTGLDPLPAGLLHQFPVQMADICFDLFFKIFAWQSEPVQGKGGILAVIPKKQDHSRASHFRGIMLLPSIFKRLHAILRKKVIDVIAPLKPAGQIGGFEGQQVQFGSMSLQCLSRIAKNHQISMGIVFVDLANAFHRLIRELACGIARTDDVAAVIANLQQSGKNTAGVQKWLEFPCLLQRLGAPETLVGLLRDVHAHTWHVLSAHPGLTRTRRGTRPGSPLADVIFHVAMLDVTIELNDWIAGQTVYADLLKRLNIQVESIVWSDDLAIPWLTESAHDLPTALQALMSKIHQVFLRRGFDLNMQKGKTTAVVTFRGQGAPDLRRQFQLSSPSGIECPLGAHEGCWLHFVPAYKHLGTFLAADGGFDVEMKHRIGQATSAFAMLAKPVLCNKHLRVSVRIRLFHSLVGTRLFFGLGAWPTPSARQLARLNAVWVKFLRRILSVAYQGGNVRTTDAQVLAWARCPDARVRLAQDRLLLAHKLFMQGPAFLHHILHREYACSDNSWMHGLFADLRWLNKLDSTAVPDTWTTNLTEPIEFWQNGGRGWKATVRRLGRRHLFQEKMMMEVKGWHRIIFQTLERAGATFCPHPAATLQCGQLENFPCFCGRTFSTAVGLATHQRKMHDIFSAEHSLLSGATCPACMRFFWTTQRLQQHLAYVSRKTGRNECFQQLRRAGYVAEYERVARPQHLQGLDRANWVQSHGPANLLPDQRIDEIARIEQSLNHLQHAYSTCRTPHNEEVLSTELFQAWTKGTWQWLEDFRRSGYDACVLPTLGDRWIDGFGTVDVAFDMWVELQFRDWGQKVLGDVIAQFEDGEAESLADEAFLSLYSEMPLFDHERTCTALRARINFLMHLDPDVPHRQVYMPPPSRAREVVDEILMSFEDQQAWHDGIRKELRQCHQGTSFSLQTLYVAALHLAFGGVFLSEHPACPVDPLLASIWRSALVDLFRALPECTLQTFHQWRWGSVTPKPTGLLSIGLPFLAKSMYDCADDTLTYPDRVAQGVGSDGRFRTADCKEYPRLFCKALAKSLTDRFEQALRLQDFVEIEFEDDVLHTWLNEAVRESSAIYSFATIRPDYQGR